MRPFWVLLAWTALAADFATVYNINTYRAAGNGKTLDTSAIQKAIDAAHVRDISFNAITIYTKGRILVEGTPESLIDRISFHDILMRMAGYEKIESVKKLNGGTTAGVPGLPDYGPTPAAMVFAYAKGLTLDGITTLWPSAKDQPGRAAVFGDHLEDVQITGFHGTASLPGTRAIRIQNSKDVRD